MLRRLLCVATALSLLAVPVAATAKPITGKKARFSRCPKSAKSLIDCPDIFYNDFGGTFDFQLEKTWCDYAKPETPGAWSFYPGLEVKKGKINQTYVYRSLEPGNEADPSYYEITFHIKGGFTSPKRLKLKITGRFTNDNTKNAQCDAAKINETHVLTVHYQK